MDANILMFDYAKFKLGPSDTEVQDQVSFARAALSQFEELHGIEPQWTVCVLPATKRRSKTVYLETWGETATFVAMLNPWAWLPKLVRADVKLPVAEMTELQILDDGKALVEKGGPYNIQLFNSRARSGKGGKSQGGVGFAIGSHKSNCRVSVYKKPHQTAGIEVQLQGPVLLRFVTRSLAAYKGVSHAPSDVWDALKRFIYLYGQERHVNAVVQASLLPGPQVN